MNTQRSTLVHQPEVPLEGSSPLDSASSGLPWWQNAVTYQVYLRSFADGNGDGIGDLTGLRARLGHIASLGVDAIWLNPCYASPQHDHGYDIADYFAIEPDYGTVEDLEALVQEAAGYGIRILMDMVANHCSSDHAWFQQALASPPGSPERERFYFRDGRGEGGNEPPNNWGSVFGGGAWTRTIDPDGTPGQWYLHLFDSTQPDFNWGNPEVAEYFDEVLRFWFNKGVAGFRIDVGHGMAKDPSLDDYQDGVDHPGWNQPQVHDIYRRWRSVGDAAAWSEPRYFVGEVWVTGKETLQRYLAPDQLHQVFNFDLLVQPWEASFQRAAIERGLELAGESTPPAWTLSNHDVHRAATRYGQEQVLEQPDPGDMIAAARRRTSVDVELGKRRAIAGLALELALPGGVYVYQGEELALPEVLDLADDLRQDPIWFRTGGQEYGRDGCRVPLPWQESAPNLGFSQVGADVIPQPAWLPQPASYADYAVETLARQPDSALAITRNLIRVRRELYDPTAPLRWIDTEHPQVLAFRRGDAVCVTNFGEEPIELSKLNLGTEASVVASSSETQLEQTGTIDANTTLWLRT